MITNELSANPSYSIVFQS